jgi:hypothetical protein
MAKISSTEMIKTIQSDIKNKIDNVFVDLKNEVENLEDHEQFVKIIETHKNTIDKLLDSEKVPDSLKSLNKTSIKKRISKITDQFNLKHGDKALTFNKKETTKFGQFSAEKSKIIKEQLHKIVDSGETDIKKIDWGIFKIPVCFDEMPTSEEDEMEITEVEEGLIDLFEPLPKKLPKSKNISKEDYEERQEEFEDNYELLAKQHIYKKCLNKELMEELLDETKNKEFVIRKMLTKIVGFLWRFEKSTGNINEDDFEEKSSQKSTTLFENWQKQCQELDSEAVLVTIDKINKSVIKDFGLKEVLEVANQKSLRIMAAIVYSHDNNLEFCDGAEQFKIDSITIFSRKTLMKYLEMKWPTSEDESSTEMSDEED